MKRESVMRLLCSLLTAALLALMPAAYARAAETRALPALKDKIPSELLVLGVAIADTNPVFVDMHAPAGRHGKLMVRLVVAGGDECSPPSPKCSQARLFVAVTTEDGIDFPGVPGLRAYSLGNAFAWEFIEWISFSEDSMDRNRFTVVSHQ